MTRLTISPAIGKSWESGGRVAARREGTQAADRFRPDIQGMRALAVTMVVLFHLYPSVLPGGFAGVDVFFVISGFLITGHLWREYRKTGRVSLVDFWGRRARRLIPAAALVLAVTWAGAQYLLPASRLASTATQIRDSALYFQNWYLAAIASNYFKSSNAASPVEHFWSLSVEEQFYLVWPLLFLVAALVAFLAGRRAPRRAGRHSARAGAGLGDGQRGVSGYRVIVVLTAALFAGSLAYSVYAARAESAQAYFVTTTRMWELAAGGLLALLPARFAAVLARQAWLGWAGLAAVAASPLVLSGSAGYPGAVALLPVGGAVALIAAPGRGHWGPARLLSLRPLVFLGGISYSLYLWHWPVIVAYTSYRGHQPGMLSGPVLIVVSVLLAWLSKVLVEDKIRLAPFVARHRWRSIGTALAAVVPVTLASVYLMSMPTPGNGPLPAKTYPGAAVLAGTVPEPQAEPIRPSPLYMHIPGYWSKGCLEKQESPALDRCVFGDTAHPRLTIALVGDSIAGNWWAPLDKIAKQEHWELVTELHSSCEWTATMLTDPLNEPKPYVPCHDWGVKALHDLIDNVHPDIVITSGLASHLAAGHPVHGTQSRADVGAGMAQYWRTLLDHGIQVLAIRSTPLFPFNVRDCLTKFSASTATAVKVSGCSVPRSEAVIGNQPFDYAAAQLGGKVKVIDLNSLICGQHVCKPVVGNILIYNDRHHVVSAFSMTLAPYLKERLLKASPLLAASAR